MVVSTDTLLKEYLRKLVNKKKLSHKEAIDLIRFYKNEFLSSLTYTSPEVEDIFFRQVSRQRLYYELEQARRYFKKKLHMWNINHIDNVDKSKLKENEIIYSKDHIPYVWEDGEFKKIKYFE
jgi:hypothetical protein